MDEGFVSVQLVEQFGFSILTVQFSQLTHLAHLQLYDRRDNAGIPAADAGGAGRASCCAACC